MITTNSAPASGIKQREFDPVARARTLRPLLEKNADLCESSGRITDEVFAALKEEGLFGITAPTRSGGRAVTMITQIETVAEIAKGCVGTAWAYSLLSFVTGGMRALPMTLQEQLFKRGDELFCSGAAPTGFADPTDDGFYRVSGKWGYCSGCPHADWALNGVLVRDNNGKVIDSGSCFINLHDPNVEILDNWHVAGMAGSGSNMVVASDLRVHEALILRKSQRGAKSNENGLEARDRWPLEPVFPLGVLGPLLGAATAMLELVANAMENRSVAWWSYNKQQNSEYLVGELGYAALEIDTAWMHVQRAAAMMDVTAQERELTGFDKARIQADCGYATGVLRTVGNRLMDIAGPGAFAQENPLQRFWRDLNVGTRHNALNDRFSKELYGHALLGHDSTFSLLPDISPPPEWSTANQQA